jgi:hypothetical protein
VEDGFESRAHRQRWRARSRAPPPHRFRLRGDRNPCGKPTTATICASVPASVSTASANPARLHAAEADVPISRTMAAPAAMSSAVDSGLSTE